MVLQILQVGQVVVLEVARQVIMVAQFPVLEFQGKETQVVWVGQMGQQRLEVVVVLAL